MTRPSDAGASRGLLAELKRRKVYRTGAAYAVGAFVVSEAADIAFPALGLPPSAMTFVVVVALGGFPVAIALAWAFEIVPAGTTPESGNHGDADAPDGGEVAEPEEGAKHGGRADRAPPAVSTNPPPARRRWPRFSTLGRSLRIGILTLTFVACGGVAWRVFPRPVAELPDDGRLLIADLENHAGDTIFDHALVDALRVGLEQSPHIRIVPRTEIRAGLEAMRRDPGGALDEPTALELALRGSITAVVVPSIQRVGTRYRLTSRVLDPADGRTIVSRSADADREDDVLIALDELARQLRADVGESLASMVRQRVPLYRATTHSLAALRAWTEANRHGEAGRTEEAYRMYRRAIELDSTFALAHSGLGQIYYWDRADPERGEHHFDLAMRYAEDVTGYERMMIEGKALEWRGDRQGAAAVFRSLVEQHPDDDVAWGNLAYQHLMLGNRDRAIEAYERVLELDSLRASAWINLATLHNAKGERTRAHELYRRAFELAPDYLTSTNINHEYGLNLIGMGRVEEAERVHERLLDEPSPARQAQAHRSIAMIRFLEGRFEAAEERLRQAVVLNRSEESWTSELRNRGFLIEARMRRGASADAELAAAAELAVERYIASHWVHLIGVWLARTGRVERARELLDTARARVDEAPVSRAGIMRLEAEVALAGGDEATALERLRVADAVHPAWTLVEARLAELYERRGDVERAAALWQEIVERTDGSSGDETLADRVLARYHLGRIREAHGRLDDARQHYRDFLDFWGDGDGTLDEVRDARVRLAELDEASAARDDPLDR